MSYYTCETLPSGEQTEISTTVSPKFRGTGSELLTPFTVTLMRLSGTSGRSVTELQQKGTVSGGKKNPEKHITIYFVNWEILQTFYVSAFLNNIHLQSSIFIHTFTYMCTAAAAFVYQLK